MNQTVAEAIVLTINAIGAGILLFIACVLQPMMDGMTEERFKEFLNSLVRAAMSDPISVTIGTLPLVAAVLYFVSFGFDHWWFTAGFAIWLIGSVLTKIINMPIYQWVANPAQNDPAMLRSKRRQLQTGNRLRACLTLASVALMAAQFSPLVVLIVILASVVLALPLLRLARMYIPS
jgi:hypothetical protein